MLNPKVMQHEIVTGFMELRHRLTDPLLQRLERMPEIRQVSCVEFESAHGACYRIDIASIGCSAKARGLEYGRSSADKGIQHHHAAQVRIAVVERVEIGAWCMAHTNEKATKNGG